MDKNPRKSRRESGGMTGEHINPFPQTPPAAPAVGQWKEHKSDIVNGNSNYSGERRHIDPPG